MDEIPEAMLCPTGMGETDTFGRSYISPPAQA